MENTPFISQEEIELMNELIQKSISLVQTISKKLDIENNRINRQSQTPLQDPNQTFMDFGIKNFSNNTDANQVEETPCDCDACQGDCAIDKQGQIDRLNKIVDVVKMTMEEFRVSYNKALVELENIPSNVISEYEKAQHRLLIKSFLRKIMLIEFKINNM